MKKQILFVVSAVIALSFAACGNQKAAETTEAPVVEETVEVAIDTTVVAPVADTTAVVAQ